jgi:hypothetical protein
MTSRGNKRSFPFSFLNPWFSEVQWALITGCNQLHIANICPAVFHFWCVRLNASFHLRHVQPSEVSFMIQQSLFSVLMLSYWLARVFAAEEVAMEDPQLKWLHLSSRLTFLLLQQHAHRFLSHCLLESSVQLPGKFHDNSNARFAKWQTLCFTVIQRPFINESVPSRTTRLTLYVLPPWFHIVLLDTITRWRNRISDCFNMIYK